MSVHVNQVNVHLPPSPPPPPLPPPPPPPPPPPMCRYFFPANVLSHMDKDSEPFQHEEDFNSIMEVCYGSAVHVMVCAAVHNTMSFRL